MQWQTLYKDGSIHTEEELKSHGNIDQEQLKEFHLLKDGKVVISLFMDSDKKLIYRKRTFMKGSTPVGSVYLVGYRPRKGKPVIFYIYEDGHIEIDNARSDEDLATLHVYDFERWD